MEHAFSPRELINLAWFLGWLVAVIVLFLAAQQLPLQTRFKRPLALLYNAGVVVVSFAVVLLANTALSLHDAYIDLTREHVFTPSQQALEVVDQLDQPVKLTYFYQGEDQNGRRARDIVEVMGRRNPLLDVQTIDPDKQPTLAQNFGVKFYNAAVLEADGRRVLVRSTDESEIAIGIQRVLRQRVIQICFIEGHNEYPIDNFEFHTHLEGVSGHNHDDAASAIIRTTEHGMGRMRRSLEALGYDVRKIIPARAKAIPPDCTVVINAGPRNTYLPAESELLTAYLQQGGSLLLMYDLGFVLEPQLERLLQTLGVRLPQQVVLDPTSHYGNDPEMVAVTAYDPHPITRRVSFTFYPGVRAIEQVQPAPGINTFALITSSSDSYSQTVAAVEQREIISQPISGSTAEPVSEPATGQPQPHILAVASEGQLPASSGQPSGQPFRALVIGDSDFASNSFFPYMANSDLALAMVRWLAREERNVPIASRIPVPSLILLTQAQMQGIFLLLVVLLPLAVLALGGIIWWRRR